MPSELSPGDGKEYLNEKKNERFALSAPTDVPLREKVHEDENSGFHVEGRYSKNSRELMESSLGSRYLHIDQKLQQRDTRDTSLFSTVRYDVLSGKSVDHISLHFPHLLSDSESSWDQVQSKERSTNTGVEYSSMDHTVDGQRRASGNDIGRLSENDFEAKFDRYGSFSSYYNHVAEAHNHPEDHLGNSVEWKPLKWVRSGNLSSCRSWAVKKLQTVFKSKFRKTQIEINIPELNPDMDVYRIGTLMELIRVIALTFADDGKRVKVCVQGSMGEGVLVGMPLQLAGTRHILEFMDWGDYDAKGTFINIGSIGAKEVTDQDDMFILLAPQNAVGNCIIDDLQAMSEAAGSRPVILVNPRLKDMPSSGGVMQTIGRDKRMEFAASFSNCYYFRLLYKVGTQYPIVGALRMCYPYPYDLYKRIDTEYGKEKYVSIATFTEKPTSEQINDAFSGRLRKKESTPTGLWGLLSGIF